MSDSKNNAGSPDSKRIDVNEEYELREWAESLGVTQTAVKDAVAAVGTSVAAVMDYLNKK